MDRRKLIYIYHCICAGIATFLNLILILLILKCTKRDMGKYKYLILAFTVFNIGYPVVHTLAAPTIFAHKRSYVLVSTATIFSNKTINYIMVIVYCSFYIQSLMLLMFQFVYRYINICRNALLDVLHTRRVFFGVVIFYAAVVVYWGMAVHVGLHVYPHEIDYFDAAFTEHFNVSAHKVPGIGAIFESTEIAGVRYINWRPYIGMMCLNSMMTVFCAIMVFCGWQVYQTLEKMVKSEKTAKLQKELFKALLVQFWKSQKQRILNRWQKELFKALLAQTFIPVVLEYLPCFIIYTTAIFGLPIDLEFTCMLIALDPIIEPIAIVYFIKDYRRAVFRCFRPTGSLESISRSTKIVMISAGIRNYSETSKERNTEKTAETASQQDRERLGGENL